MEVHTPAPWELSSNEVGDRIRIVKRPAPHFEILIAEFLFHDNNVANMNVLKASGELAEALVAMLHDPVSNREKAMHALGEAGIWYKVAVKRLTEPKDP